MRVVQAHEMARLEKLAFQEGVSADALMQKAALGIADAIDQYIQKNNLEKQVTFVAGKGNNGGDAFCAALLLIEKGYRLTGYHTTALEDCSELCQKYGKSYQLQNKRLTLIKNPKQLKLPTQGILLDGLLGTGFEGAPTAFLETLFKLLNQSSIPCFAIDVPSGLNGNTGKVVEAAVKATYTLFLGLPKKGFFIRDGWNHVGKLIHVDFGLEDKYIVQAKAEFNLLQDLAIQPFFPKIIRNRHKYEAGYVVGFTGSKGMMGASLLSGMAALKSGAGIVKVIHLEDEFVQSTAYPELIHHTFDYNQIDEALELISKATCVYLGPGMGTSEKTAHFLTQIIPQIDKPCVLDADALTIIAENELTVPKEALLTPHLGEMQRLLGQKPKTIDALFELCQKYVDERRITLLLKGGPSFIFNENQVPYINPTGDPGMATAGSGDVLTGILVGLLSQVGMNPLKAAQLGVYLHGRVGEIVAKQKSSYGLTASDLLDYLYKVFPK